MSSRRVLPEDLGESLLLINGLFAQTTDIINNICYEMFELHSL